MKRIISILILLFIPIFVFADTMGPVYAGYNAIINSANGVNLYSMTEEKELKVSDIHLDNNEKVYIMDEIEISKGFFFGEVEYNCDKNDNCESYYINLNKITKVGEDKVYSPDELNKEIINRYGRENVSDLEKINKPAISIKKGINIYNYPSYAAKKLSYNISQYEEFTAVTYILKLEGTTDVWFYLKNNNIEGWVNYKDGLAYNKDGTYEFDSETTTYKDINCEDESDYSIPEDTKLKGNNVYQLSMHDVEESYKDDYLLIKYKNKYYWIDDYFENDENALEPDSSDTNEEKESTYICLKDINYYEKIGGKKVGKIPAGTVLDIIQTIEEDIDDETKIFYYIKYNNDLYLIDKDDTEEIEMYDSCLDRTTMYKVNYYEKIGGKKVGTIPANTNISECASIDTDEENYLYIEYKNKKYWVTSDYISQGNFSYLVIRDTDIYDSIGGKSIGKVNANEIQTVYHSEEKGVIIQKNGKYGWLKTNDVIIKNLYHAKSIIVGKDDKAYDKLYGKKIENPLTKDTTVKTYYEYTDKDTNEIWVFIEENNIWVKWTNEKDIKETNETIPEEMNNKTKNEEPSTIQIDKGLSNKTKIIISIFSSIIIAISTIVSIILINKKKKVEVGEVNEKNN